MPETETQSILGSDPKDRARDIPAYLESHVSLVHALLQRISTDGIVATAGYVTYQSGDEHPQLTDSGWELVTAARTAALGSFEFLYDLEGETVGGEGADGLLREGVRLMPVVAAALSGVEREGHPAASAVTWGLHQLLDDLHRRVQAAVRDREESHV